MHDKNVYQNNRDVVLGRAMAATLAAENPGAPKGLEALYKTNKRK